ncbi:MAG: MFS transporter [Planctomycetaceae bacterium]|nr:MFS transporter [Planctomycetaceae bacterium]
MPRGHDRCSFRRSEFRRRSSSNGSPPWETFMNSAVRLKLSIMMFLQYAIWGAWAVSIGGYLGDTLGFSGAQIGAVYATTAIAAMISPIYVGYLADKMFATEKMIAVLHLIGAGLLGAAALTTSFEPLRAIMLAYSICYMPTLALTNSISFANIGDPEKEFPGIRVWGTWGWIVVGWVVGFVLDNPSFKEMLPESLRGGNAPIFLAAALSAALAAYSLVLPHTPPRGKAGNQPEETHGRRAGSSVLQLLGDPTFLVFVVCSFLICIPLAFYYNFANLFLKETDAPFPTALQTIGQMSEVGFMAAMPFFIQRLGVKKMLAVGMLAWVVRYFCFGTLQFPLVVIGLILHGVCYDFFFVASQIYVDSRAASHQRASAQSFIALVTLGVGMFVGAYVGGLIVDSYPAPVKVTATVETGTDGKQTAESVPLPAWDPSGESGLAREMGLKADSLLSIDALPEQLTVVDEKTKDRTIYEREPLMAAAKQADADGDGKLSRKEWRLAQAHDWFHIWLWPAIAAAVTCGIFWIGFRAPTRPASASEETP